MGSSTPRRIADRLISTTRGGGGNGRLPGASAARPPLWRNDRARRIGLQIIFLALLVALLFYLVDNVRTNLDRLGIETNFGYLDQPAGFAIPDSDFRSSQSLLDALLVGVVNTVKVSLLGIALATVLGIVVGVARLSPNWLVRQSAAIYVETLRNIPVLVIILFWYLAVLLRAPEIGSAIDWGGWFVLSNRGIVLPWAGRTDSVLVFLAVLGVGLAFAAAAVIWRTCRFNASGRPHHRGVWALGILAVAVVAAFFAGGKPFAASLPELGELGTENGLRLTPEFVALLVGITIYTASHIAEIVRGAILAVPRGQTEAANALGLSGFQRMRHVTLPQAFRIIIPPLTNQYLNLAKNSSLGVVIAFPEVTRITQITIAQGGPAPQAIAVLMLIYLIFSLSVSLITNISNRQLTLKGR